MRNHPAWGTPLDNLRLRVSGSSDAPAIRRAAFNVVSALQHSPPEVQLDALFVAAVAMSEALGLDPHERVTRARRALPDLEGPFTSGDQLAAIRAYATGELRK